MYKLEINFGGIRESIFTEKDIFQPNLTSQLSYETAITLIKNNYKVLDLGCGTGIIGIMIMKKFPQVEMHCSDVDEKSIQYAKKNFIEKKIRADIRKGDLLNIWKGKKFDYIINDVSGISNLIAKKSPWFNNFVPCDVSGKIPPTLDYLWDDIHFNIGGAKKAGEIIFECIIQALDIDSLPHENSKQSKS